jgi:hypothetical protein
MFKAYGPTKIPVAIYPTTKGCLKAFMIMAIKVARTTIIEISINIGISVLSFIF